MTNVCECVCLMHREKVVVFNMRKTQHSEVGRKRGGVVRVILQHGDHYFLSKKGQTFKMKLNSEQHVINVPNHSLLIINGHISSGPACFIIRHTLLGYMHVMNKIGTFLSGCGHGFDGPCVTLRGQM